MSQTRQQPPAGWYPDPAGSGDERYWDGGTWSQVTRPSGGLHAAAGAQPNRYQQTYHQPAHGQQAQGSGRLAGWWWRVLAALLDYLIFFVPSMFVLPSLPFMTDLQDYYADVFMASSQGSMVIPELPQTVTDGLAAYSLVMALLWFGYRGVMVALKGATLGQMATGLRVRDVAGTEGQIGWGRSFLRAAIAVVTWQVPVVGPLVYALVPLFNSKKQTLHDLLAKTVVVKK